MSLKNQIEGDLKKAMLEKKKDELRALRAIKSMILLAQTEKGGNTDLTPESEIKILQKAVKQRTDSIELYRSQNRDDLADAEQAEVDVIKKYLPEQLSEDELKKIISQIVDQTGAAGMKDMGKVMGLANQQLAGKADGKTIAQIVKSILS